MSTTHAVPRPRHHHGRFAYPRPNVHESSSGSLDPYPHGVKPSSVRASILSTSATGCCPSGRHRMYYYPLSTRNPYQTPGYENDDDFRGKFQGMKQPLLLEGWQYRTQDPWDRVYHHHTLSSLRHQWCRAEPDAANDSLDFILKSNYHHQRDGNRSKAEVITQPESRNMKHNRLYKNRVHVVFKTSELGHPLQVADFLSSEHPSSKKQQIRGNHLEITNPGYARKEDGTYFFS